MGTENRGWTEEKERSPGFQALSLHLLDRMVGKVVQLSEPVVFSQMWKDNERCVVWRWWWLLMCERFRCRQTYQYFVNCDAVVSSWPLWWWRWSSHRCVLFLSLIQMQSVEVKRLIWCNLHQVLCWAPPHRFWFIDLGVKAEFAFQPVPRWGWWDGSGPNCSSSARHLMRTLRSSERPLFRDCFSLWCDSLEWVGL